MEPKRGLFAGGGTTVRLPRQIPWPQAMEFLLCADLIPAERAFEMGLLNAVVPREQLLDTAREYAAAHRRQRAARGAGHEAERVAGPLLRRGRHAGAARRGDAAARSRRRPAPIPAAVAEVLDALAQGAAHAVREGEPALVADLPDRGREGRPEGVRREASARSGKRSEPIDPERAVHHRRRAAHVASRRRRAGGRARAARHVGARRARPRPPTRAGPTSITAHRRPATSCTARRGSTTTRSQRLADRLGADPKQRLLLGHRRHDGSAAR